MADTLTLSTLTQEFVEVFIGVRDDDTTDPTGDVVKLAFIKGPAKPTAPDWVTGSWRVGDSGAFYARALIGPPSGKILTPGTYVIWATWIDNPEIPARDVGYLRIV